MTSASLYKTEFQNTNIEITYKIAKILFNDFPKDISMTLHDGTSNNIIVMKQHTFHNLSERVFLDLNNNLNAKSTNNPFNSGGLVNYDAFMFGMTKTSLNRKKTEIVFLDTNKTGINQIQQNSQSTFAPFGMYIEKLKKKESSKIENLYTPDAIREVIRLSTSSYKFPKEIKVLIKIFKNNRIKSVKISELTIYDFFKNNSSVYEVLFNLSIQSSYRPCLFSKKLDIILQNYLKKF